MMKKRQQKKYRSIMLPLESDGGKLVILNPMPEFLKA